MSDPLPDPVLDPVRTELGEPRRVRGRVLRHTTRGLVVLAYVGTWLALTVAAAAVIFLQDSRTVTVASHDAVLRPTLSGHVVVLTGPVLPDLRLESGSRLGVDVRLGKTQAASVPSLVSRYAVIASQPQGPEAKIRAALLDMARDALLRGALLGLLPILVWALVGPRRRRELLARLPTRQGALSVLLAGLLVVGWWRPWDPDESTIAVDRDWTSLQEFVGAGVALPAEAEGLEVRGDVTTRQTRRLVQSAVETFRKSRTFYAAAAEEAVDLDLRRPEEGESVAVLVSDRHDNTGMDAVARAIGDAAGATAVLDAGDDTSTGGRWEAFSLDSLDAAFDGDPYDGRWAVAGNHDNGDFVVGYLDDLGWTMLDGEVVDGPDGGRLLGVHDPRSSGLGSWRDETGLSFDEVGGRLADAACSAAEDGERVATVLVHDANLGDEALARGCVDLVVGGHLHVQVGPDRVVAADGSVGYSYTNGTTGGAAYAIAIGSKIRRDAQVSLVTYREGRPAGIQSVTLRTDGRFLVDDYVPLVLGED